MNHIRHNAPRPDEPPAYRFTLDELDELVWRWASPSGAAALLVLLAAAAGAEVIPAHLRLRSPAERLWRERIGSLDGRRGPTRERGGRRRAATIASWFFAEAGPPLHLFHHIADEVKSLPREPFDHSLATQAGGFFDVAPLEHERFYEFVLKRPLAASAPASRRGWRSIPSPRPACAQQALHRGGPH